MNLLNHLLEQKIIDKEEKKVIQKKKMEENKTLEEVILEEDILEEKRLFQIKSELVKFPRLEREIKKISQSTLSLIPQETSEFYKMVPLKLDRANNVLEVGMVNPEDGDARKALRFLLQEKSLESKIYLVTLSEFKKYSRQYNAPEEQVKEALGEVEKGEEKKGVKKKKEELQEEMKEGESAGEIGKKAPIVKVVSVILRQAVDGRASDIHIEPTREDLRVRYRKDGILHTSLLLPLNIRAAVIARIKILSDMKIDETRVPQDGRFSAVIKGREIDFRVSTFPTRMGEKVAIRILDPEEGLKDLEELGLRGRDFNIVKRVINDPYGIVLSTGPTGSGKTTTLYALLRRLNEVKRNIVTLEDPIEYFVNGINQSQARPDIGFTFAKGLRQILRQDPDMIMVGEIRDEDTTSLAIQAGLTGHLVLSTLHTNTASSVVPRLLNLGARSFLLPTTLSLVIGQRLVRTLCDNCKKKTKATEGEKKYMLREAVNLPEEKIKKIKEEPLYIYRPQGCEKCNEGYSGRIGIFEVIEMTHELANIVAESPNEEKIREQARKQGMTSVKEDGITKVLEGTTSLEEVMRIV